MRAAIMSRDKLMTEGVHHLRPQRCSYARADTAIAKEFSSDEKAPVQQQGVCEG